MLLSEQMRAQAIGATSQNASLQSQVFVARDELREAESVVHALRSQPVTPRSGGPSTSEVSARELQERVEQAVTRAVTERDNQTRDLLLQIIEEARNPQRGKPKEGEPEGEKEQKGSD